MSTATLRKAALLIVAVAVFGSSAFAREPHDNKRDDRERHERMERREHRERFERARAEERRRERERWERRREEERRRHERERWEAEHRRDEHHPNGWDHGKKNGWRGNDVPPGQAKKIDGHQEFHGSSHDRSDHDWDRSHNGQTRMSPRDSNGNQKSHPWNVMLDKKK